MFSRSGAPALSPIDLQAGDAHVRLLAMTAMATVAVVFGFRECAAQQLNWIRQEAFGVPDLGAFAHGIATDGAGSIYTAGSFSEGVSAGPGTSAVPAEAFLARYNPSGDLLWSETLGIPAYQESFNAVTVDSSGSVIVAGNTRGDLLDENRGTTDLVGAKYHPNGVREWARQLGASGADWGRGITTDSLGNIFVAGTTQGFDSPGLGGTHIDDGWDAYVAKLDIAGNVQSIEQFGGARWNESNSIATDAMGNVYITGNEADESLSNSAIFVRKMDSDGALIWSTTIDTESQDDGEAIAIDSDGSVFVGGETLGAIADDSNLGGRDAFLQRYDADGNLLWSTQFGTEGADSLRGVAVDDQGRVFV
ncbi:MAG: SBBP repeat-containing protein, partial [Planctomycetota bacterium]